MTKPLLAFGLLVAVTALTLRFTVFKNLPKGYQHPVMGFLRILAVLLAMLLVAKGLEPIAGPVVPYLLVACALLMAFGLPPGFLRVSRRSKN